MSDADARRREQRKRELEEKRAKLQQFKDQNTKIKVQYYNIKTYIKFQSIDLALSG
jgi:hypothetical protein